MKPSTNIQYWRKKRGFSQRGLSELVNISAGYISDIESGKKLPSISLLYRIAEALEVCPRQLLKCNDINCSTCCYKK